MTEAPERRVVFRQVPGWPRLAWVARVSVEQAGEPVLILHGSCVETRPSWCFEGVWPGAFRAGDFDEAEVAVGTGVRIRGQRIVFVTSGDTLNRLVYCSRDGVLFVSNSLPGLLATTNLSLLPDHDYVVAAASIERGLDDYVREIPTSGPAVRQLYFDHLVVDERAVREVSRPRTAPDFAGFSTYRDYLFSIAAACGVNAASPERRNCITPLTTISRGYDSPVAAILSLKAGARHAVTIARARRVASNLFDLNDSGAAIAAQLGLSCAVYDRRRTEYPYEDAVWSVMGNVGDVNLTVFDYPSPLCLLFTGFTGGSLWDRSERPRKRMERLDTSGARFSECRLELGVFNCAPAFWGSQQQAAIEAITRSNEMRPWSRGGKYDRPIPRRIAEEAGVGRDSFGLRKRAASFNRQFGRPLSSSLRPDFAAFAARLGCSAVPGPMEQLSLWLRAIERVALRRLPEPFRLECGKWIRLPDPNVFLLWGMERRSERYASVLRGSHFSTSASSLSPSPSGAPAQ